MCVDAARLHYPSGVYVVSSGRKPLNRMHDILAPGGVFVLFDFAQRAKRFTPVPPRRLLRDFDVSFTEHILNHAYQNESRFLFASAVYFWTNCRVRRRRASFFFCRPIF